MTEGEPWLNSSRSRGRGESRGSRDTTGRDQTGLARHLAVGRLRPSALVHRMSLLRKRGDPHLPLGAMRERFSAEAGRDVAPVMLLFRQAG